MKYGKGYESFKKQGEAIKKRVASKQAALEAKQNSVKRQIGSGTKKPDASDMSIAKSTQQADLFTSQPQSQQNADDFF